MSHGREIVALMKEIEVMPEFRLYTQIRDLEMSEFTFLGNYADLERNINVLCGESTPTQIFAVRNRDRLEAVMFHIARQLHNFVAASSSLIDHTRNLYNKLNVGKGKKLFSEYQTRVDRDFATDSLAQFVNGLRKYCQHYRMPAIVLATVYPTMQEPPQRAIMLQKPQLLEFDGWNSHAKRYLEQMPDRVELLAVATTYREKVEAFHNWFGERERAIFAPEIQRFREKEQRRVTMTLEDMIDAYTGQGSPLTKEDCFLSLFISQDYVELEQTLPDSRERVDKIIEIIERNVPISDEMKNKIIALFQPVP